MKNPTAGCCGVFIETCIARFQNNAFMDVVSGLNGPCYQVELSFCGLVTR
jgi:hypothetical protein